MSIEIIVLPSGFSIPAIGFGTWQTNDEALESALDAALSEGYRHIDTAAGYFNEGVIGKVLKKWFDAGKLKREDIFITTKLPFWKLREEDVEPALTGSLEALQLDYVDLYLVHFPAGAISKEDGTIEPDPTTDHLTLWKAMEKQVDEGRTKYIGVSNFNIKQVERILTNCRIRPATNQVEIHVYLQQNELVDYLKKNGVTITGYSSLGTPGSKESVKRDWNAEIENPKLMEDPVVLEIAKKRGKTAAQVLLRHVLQRGIVIIPKSNNPDRIKQNFEVQDWSLDEEDMKKLNALDRNFRIVDMKVFVPGFENHPEYPL